MFIAIICIIGFGGLILLSFSLIVGTKLDVSMKKGFKKFGEQEKLVGKSLSQIESVVGPHDVLKDELSGGQVVHVYYWGSVMASVPPTVALYFNDNKICIGIKHYYL